MFKLPDILLETVEKRRKEKRNKKKKLSPRGLFNDRLKTMESLFHMEENKLLKIIKEYQDSRKRFLHI